MSESTPPANTSPVNDKSYIVFGSPRPTAPQATEGGGGFRQVIEVDKAVIDVHDTTGTNTQLPQGETPTQS